MNRYFLETLKEFQIPGTFFLVSAASPPETISNRLWIYSTPRAFLHSDPLRTIIMARGVVRLGQSLVWSVLTLAGIAQLSAAEFASHSPVRPLPQAVA